MKIISELTNQVVVDIKTNPKFEYRPPFGKTDDFSDQDYAIVNKLFKTFVTIFPAFRNAWPTQQEFDAAKKEWMKAFKLAKLTDVEIIKIGVNKYRLAETPFVPSPGQFIAMCGVSPSEERCRIPFYAQSAIESDEIKERRKKDARKHLDAIKALLK
jgi:hypothetical protein